MIRMHVVFNSYNVLSENYFDVKINAALIARDLLWKFENVYPPTYDQETKVYPSLPSETKVDSSFPSNQFVMEGFNFPFRLDRNSSGGGIMLFVMDEIFSKHLSQYKPNSSVENIFVEINLQSKQ